MKKIDVVLLSLMLVSVIMMIIRIIAPIPAHLILSLLIVIDIGIIIKIAFDHSKDHFPTLLLWICLTLIWGFILFVTIKQNKEIKEIKEPTEIIYITKN